MKTTIRARWRYAFDTFMSKGAGSLILALALATVLLVAIAAFVLSVFGVPTGDGETLGVGEALWQSLMHAMDAGAVGADSGWSYRLVMFAVTLGGIFVLSALIGVINSGLESRFEELRKGRSAVVETGHTVVLGWNEDLFAILKELVAANANRRRACVAILARRDKVEMEDEIRERLPDLGTTRVVCRTGDPCGADDLAIVSVATSRAVMVLSPGGDSGDAETIKALLAVTSRPHDSGKYHCVAEIMHPRNEKPALIAAKGQVKTVRTSDILARTIAQTCRQSGLSVVYEELLDFGGCELYFQKTPELEGARYRDVVTRFRTSAVMGLVDAQGRTWLNPKPEAPLGKGWGVIALSEDDDTVVPDGIVRQSAPAELPSGGSGNVFFAAGSLFVFLGWSYKLPVILRELDAYVGSGTRAILVSSRREEPIELGHIRDTCGNFKSIEYLGADVTDRDILEGLPLAEANHVVVLCNEEDYGAAEADSRALIALLHLRDIASGRKLAFSLTCELLDARTRELAAVAEADDFIVSDRLIGLLLVQIAENPALYDVFSELFSADGSEIYFKPIEDYVEPGSEVDGYAVFAAAAARGQSALGWRAMAKKTDAATAFGVVLNPNKADRVRFAKGDKLIVVAGE